MDMKIRNLFLFSVVIAAVIAPVSAFEAVAGKETQGTAVKGKNLLVNGTMFVVKGICYQPTPVGESEDGAWRTNPHTSIPIYERDFPMIKALGANTICTWREASPWLLDIAEKNGIKVIAGYFVDPRDNLSDAVTRKKIISDFEKYIRELKKSKSYNAVLFYSIGNRLASYVFSGSPSDVYSLFNEMAKRARGAGAGRPVAIIGNRGEYIGKNGIASDDDIKNIDIIGTRVYFKSSEKYEVFLSSPDGLNAKTSKPIWIAQFGYDTYDNRNSKEDAGTQAKNTLPLVNFICNEASHSELTIGGTLMEYSDEWCRMGSNQKTHDSVGYPDAEILPDGFGNEEWWGVVSIADNGEAADVVSQRPIYYELQKIWR